MKLTTKKSTIYCRVSSREQEESGYSLPAQEKLLTDYATENNFKPKKIYKISESASGKQLRKSFNEMMSFTRKNNIHIILCEKIDRLTRNLKDAAVVSDWVQENNENEVHFVKENFIVNKNTKAHENLVWDMKVAIARFYTNNLSEEVRKGQKEKIAQGWLPTQPPLGYKTIGEKGHKTHIIDETKSPYIIQLFESYSNGNYSIKKLTEILYEEGLRGRYNRKVVKSQIHQLLCNPFYIGKIVWNDETYPGSQEPLINEDLFDQVQKKLNRGTKSPQYQKHLPIFKAKISCEECGGTITWETQKSHWYGHCNHYKNCSQKKYVRQEKVEEQLFPYFDKIAPQNKEVLEWLKDSLKEDHSKELAEVNFKRETLNKNFGRIQNRLDKLYDDKLDEKITLEFYDKKAEEFNQEKESITKQLKKLDENNTEYLSAGVAIHELACKAKKIYSSEKVKVEEKRLLLSYIFSNLTLNDGIVAPNHTFAFNFLSKWMPVVNTAFQTFEPAKTGKKALIRKQSATFGDGLRAKLRGSGSNRRPID
jgi:site-specific DNA recombinase